MAAISTLVVSIFYLIPLMWTGTRTPLLGFPIPRVWMVGAIVIIIVPPRVWLPPPTYSHQGRI